MADAPREEKAHVRFRYLAFGSISVCTAAETILRLDGTDPRDVARYLLFLQGVIFIAYFFIWLKKYRKHNYEFPKFGGYARYLITTRRAALWVTCVVFTLSFWALLVISGHLLDGVRTDTRAYLGQASAFAAAMVMFFQILHLSMPLTRPPEEPDLTETEEHAPEEIPLLKHTGEYNFSIVGEDIYQDALELLAGGRTVDGVVIQTAAELVPELSRTYDGGAVKVTIGGQQVGYLSDENAREYRTRMIEIGLQPHATCHALIYGGWDRGEGDRGPFGVKLDIKWPVQQA